MVEILDRMVSGNINAPSGSTSTFGDSSVVSEAISTIIDDSRVPLGVIIESVQSDTDSGILLALETFELESCIGAAQVVSEGANPVIVMEGAVKNFFKSIGDKIKQFWEWIKGIFAKIFKKSKDAKENKKLEETEKILTGKEKSADGKTYDEIIKEISADGKGNDVIGDGSLYLFNVKEATDKAFGVVDTSQVMIGDCEKDVNNLQKDFNVLLNSAKFNRQQRDAGNATSGVSYNDDARALGADEDPFSSANAKNNEAAEGSIEKAICNQIASKNHIKADTKADIIKSLNDAFGRGENAKPVTDISKLNGSILVKTVNELKQGQYESYARDTLKEFDKVLSKMKDAINEMDKDSMRMYDETGKQPPHLTKVVSRVTEMMRKLNVLGSVTTGVLSHIVNLLEAATVTYNAFAKKVLAYKKERAQTESVNYGIYLESKDVDNEDVPEDDTDDSKSATTEGLNDYSSIDAVSSFIRSYV